MYTCGNPGMRKNIADADLESVLTEDLEEEVRQAAEISMGTEVGRLTSYKLATWLSPRSVPDIRRGHG